MNRNERIARAKQYMEEGRLRPLVWHETDEQGRAIASLLGSMEAEINNTGKCPGELMPAWMAYLTVTLYDGISAAYRPEFERDYIRCLEHLPALSQEALQRAEWRVKLAALQIALPHDTAGVVQPVIDLLTRAIAGDVPQPDQWAAARATAKAAARAAAEVAAWAAAEVAAWAAARAAARAASLAAAGAASLAAAGAATLAAAGAATLAAAGAATRAAYDTIAKSLILALEVA
jgi:hypothetical protein